MQTNRSRGFTLIELLVVIAIIGILSAVVLASLNTARSKGSDAAAQSDLSSTQTEAEIYYGSPNGSTAGNNSYGALTFSATVASCATAAASIAAATSLFGDPVIAKALAAGFAAEGSPTNGINCIATPTGYAVGIALSSASTNKWWCVDSTGNAKGETTAISATTQFVGTNANTCP